LRGICDEKQQATDFSWLWTGLPYTDFCSTLFEMHSHKAPKIKVLNYELYRIKKIFNQTKDKAQIRILL